MIKASFEHVYVHLQNLWDWQYIGCYLLIYPNVLHNPRVTEAFYPPRVAFAPFTFFFHLIAFTVHIAFNFCSLSSPYALIDRSAFANGSEFFLHCNWELHGEKIIILLICSITCWCKQIFSLSGGGQYSAGDAQWSLW